MSNRRYKSISKIKNFEQSYLKIFVSFKNKTKRLKIELFSLKEYL